MEVLIFKLVKKDNYNYFLIKAVFVTQKAIMVKSGSFPVD